MQDVTIHIHRSRKENSDGERPHVVEKAIFALSKYSGLDDAAVRQSVKNAVMLKNKGSRRRYFIDTPDGLKIRISVRN